MPLPYTVFFHFKINFSFLFRRNKRITYYYYFFFFWLMKNVLSGFWTLKCRENQIFHLFAHESIKITSKTCKGYFGCHSSLCNLLLTLKYVPENLSIRYEKLSSLSLFVFHFLTLQLSILEQKPWWSCRNSGRNSRRTLGERP